jgi:dihydropyrimidine dehydrogenase (NAD+) subunit PreA
MFLPSLSTKFVGVDLSNPFIVASCPLTSDSSHILAAAKVGWGGAVTKTITAHPQYIRNLTPSFSIIRGKREIIGLGNNEVRTHLSLEEWCEREIPRIKAGAPSEFVLIGSIMEGTDPEQWGDTAFHLETAGVDIIEMNVSCAHGMPEKYMGAFINDDPDLLEKVVAGCKSKIDIPLIVKLNALSRDLTAAISACIRGGADGVAATNTLLALPSVDIYRQAPNQLVSTISPSTVMGYSGAGIRPFGLYAVALIAQHDSLPISGIGGIESWENSVEYFLLGATTVQICTAALIHGLEIVKSFKEGLIQYLIDCGNTGLVEIQGKALSNLLTPDEALIATSITKATVIDKYCTVCNKCINPCIEGATAAISLSEGKIVIDQDKCIGCGLCLATCPFEAISM